MYASSGGRCCSGAFSRRSSSEVARAGWRIYLAHDSEKDTKLAQKMGQFRPLIAVLPQRCTGQLASVGPT
jgi:hypothetical protein